MKRDKLFYFEQLFRSNFINRVAQLNLHVYAYCSDLQLVKKKKSLVGKFPRVENRLRFLPRCSCTRQGKRSNRGR